MNELGIQQTGDETPTATSYRKKKMLMWYATVPVSRESLISYLTVRESVSNLRWMQCPSSLDGGERASLSK